MVTAGACARNDDLPKGPWRRTRTCPAPPAAAGVTRLIARAASSPATRLGRVRTLAAARTPSRREVERPHHLRLILAERPCAGGPAALGTVTRVAFAGGPCSPHGDAHGQVHAPKIVRTGAARSRSGRRRAPRGRGPEKSSPSRWRFRPSSPRTFRPGLAASAYNPQRRLRPNRAPCSVRQQPYADRPTMQALCVDPTFAREAGSCGPALVS